ncbi:MAG TPA: acyltransferase [Thermoanaerobaculia bacterium]|nr:acyltransferase [Thermoanaerobaculia bacterium]
MSYPDVFIHETAIVKSDAIGAGTRVWAFCNLLPGSRIGADCQICDRVFIENGAILGDRVTVKCGVSIWTGVTIEDGVFVGPDVVFTNDPRPRSRRHLTSYPETRVRRYASLGAGSVLLPGITVGEYALVGAGAVATKDVEPFALVVGNPARRIGWVCICAARLRGATCEVCGRVFEYTGNAPPRLVSGDLSPEC